jgi:hypothetical protein
MCIMQADDVTASVLDHICCKRNSFKCGVLLFYIVVVPTNAQYSSASVSTGNMFQDLPLLSETADNTERYI